MATNTASPNTQSLISGPAGQNRTGSAVSTNIIIKISGGQAIGAIQSMQVDEARGGIEMIDEVGTDGHIDSVPNKATNITGSCDRVRYDGLRVATAFGRPFIHVKSQRIPFDILIIDTFYSNDPSTQIVTTIKNVWIKSIGYTYSADNYLITEKMVWEAEDIYSTINDNNVVSGNIVGGRNDVFSTMVLNPFELQADRGDRRGALDAAGLLVAFNEV